MSRKAAIERGMILEATEDGYLVASLDRLGIVSPPIPTIQTPELSEGDKVYFFLFQDGTGGILSLLTPDGRPSYVLSVNGKTGQVELEASDVGALPDDTVIPTKTSELSNDSGFVDASGAAAAAPVQSVNGQTGAVSVPVPTKVSDLTNDSGFVDASGAAAAAPVQSVNGQIGDVDLDAADVGALPTNFAATGSNDGWTYFRVGTNVFAWYYRQRTGIDITAEWVSGVYRSGEIELAPYPTFLNAGYNVSACLAVGSQGSGIGLGRVMDSSGAIRGYLTRPAPATGANCAVMVFAVGTWNG